MADIEITPTSLVVHMTGLDRILALKSSVTVALDHVVAIDRDIDEASVVFHGIKLPGTGIPGVVTAGSFLKKGKWTFWDVHDPAKAVIIRLRNEHYNRLVVGVDDPEAVTRSVSEALARNR